MPIIEMGKIHGQELTHRRRVTGEHQVYPQHDTPNGCIERETNDYSDISPLDPSRLSAEQSRRRRLNASQPEPLGANHNTSMPMTTTTTTTTTTSQNYTMDMPRLDRRTLLYSGNNVNMNVESAGSFLPTVCVKCGKENPEADHKYNCRTIQRACRGCDRIMTDPSEHRQYKCRQCHTNVYSCGSTHKCIIEICGFCAQTKPRIGEHVCALRPNAHKGYPPSPPFQGQFYDDPIPSPSANPYMRKNCISLGEEKMEECPICGVVMEVNILVGHASSCQSFRNPQLGENYARYSDRKNADKFLESVVIAESMALLEKKTRKKDTSINNNNRDGFYDNYVKNTSWIGKELKCNSMSLLLLFIFFHITNLRLLENARSVVDDIEMDEKLSKLIDNRNNNKSNTSTTTTTTTNATMTKSGPASLKTICTLAIMNYVELKVYNTGQLMSIYERMVQIKFYPSLANMIAEELIPDMFLGKFIREHFNEFVDDTKIELCMHYVINPYGRPRTLRGTLLILNFADTYDCNKIKHQVRNHLGELRGTTIDNILSEYKATPDLLTNAITCVLGWMEELDYYASHVLDVPLRSALILFHLSIERKLDKMVKGLHKRLISGDRFSSLVNIINECQTRPDELKYANSYILGYIDKIDFMAFENSSVYKMLSVDTQEFLFSRYLESIKQVNLHN